MDQISSIDDVLRLSTDIRELKAVDVTDDVVIAAIHRCPRLSRIDLGGCERLTDKSVLELAQLSELEHIDLSLCHQITDQSVANLARLPRLLSLSLGWCYLITDRSLELLRDCLRLEKLILWSCERISDRGVEALAALPSLVWLELPEFAEISDRSVAVLASGRSPLEFLRFVHLDGVTDAGILALSGIRTLRGLVIEECKHITQEGLQALQARLPDCKVTLQP